MPYNTSEHLRVPYNTLPYDTVQYLIIPLTIKHLLAFQSAFTVKVEADPTKPISTVIRRASFQLCRCSEFQAFDLPTPGEKIANEKIEVHKQVPGSFYITQIHITTRFHITQRFMALIG